MTALTHDIRRTHSGRETESPDSDSIRAGLIGGLAGLVAGPASLAVACWVGGEALTGPIARAADVRGVSLDAATVVAYVTVAAIGALAGAAFTSLTRELKKWFPLALWGVVFFDCLGIVLLTLPMAARRYLHGGDVAPELSLPVLAAGTVFGLLVSFSLPIRRRG
jgi:hypothetical protein